MLAASIEKLGHSYESLLIGAAEDNEESKAEDSSRCMHSNAREKVFDGSQKSAMDAIIDIKVALAMAFDGRLNDTGIDQGHFFPWLQENISVVCLVSESHETHCRDLFECGR